MVVPDLFVVCDPTTKRALYEKRGVKEYWLVNPDTLDVTIFDLQDGCFGAPRGANLAAPVAVKLFPRLELRSGV